MRPRYIIAITVTLAALATAWAIVVGPLSAQPSIRQPDGAWLESGPSERAVVWAVGNGADGSDSARAVARRIEADDPDRVLYLGDVYATSLLRRILIGEGTLHDFEANFDSVYGAMAQRIAPTPGNHEWPRRGDGYDPYWWEVHGSPPPAWYSFEVAGWQVLSLNSEAPHDARSAQVKWLRRQLHGNGNCRIAFWHEARYSAASAGGDQPDLEPLWDALQGKAVVVVNAHDHTLQRLEAVGGITPLVSGAGGHGHHELDEGDDRLLFGDDRHYGALRLDISVGRVRHSFMTADGVVLDRGTIRCRA